MHSISTKPLLLQPPQIVSYVRLFLILAGAFLFNYHAYFSLLLLTIAECLDMLDGFLARKAQLETSLGQVLDLLIDKLSVVFVFSVLIKLLPAYFAVFALILAIDLLAHMAMLYTGMLLKKVKTHKAIFQHKHALLDLYYAQGRKKVFMVFSIICYDFSILLFILYALSPSNFLYGLVVLFTTLGCIKFYIHVLHLYYGFKMLANEEKA